MGGRLKGVAGSDFALKARPERRHLCPHPTIAIASRVAPRATLSKTYRLDELATAYEVLAGGMRAELVIVP